MKRLIAIILLCCTLALALAACGKKKDDPKKTNPSDSKTEETDEYGYAVLGTSIERFQELDFGGDTIYVLVRNDEKVKREWETDDLPDAEIDAAVDSRNIIVESDLNLNVEFIYQASDQHADWERDFTASISQDVDSKLHEIDIVANFGFNGMRSTLRNYYANLLDEDLFPHFQFEFDGDATCWNRDILENGTVNGQLYTIVGDMNLSLINTAMIIWQNRTLYDKVKRSDDPENIQDLVLSQQWTYDKLFKWASWYENEGGDGECSNNYGVQIQGEQYPEQPGEAIPYAWDLELMKKEADGRFSYNFIGNTKAETALRELRDLYNSEGNAFLAFTANSNTTKKACTCVGGHFVTGNVIFKGDVLYWNQQSNLYIREMEDTYCLLPWPKYDQSQADYCTTSQGYFNVLSVLDHSKSSVKTKGEAVSAYLQYGTEFSYTHVRNYYFEKVIKSKWFGTDDSYGDVSKSIAIFMEIIDNLSFNYATIYSQACGKVMERVWKDSYVDGSTLQAKYNANQKVYDDGLAELERWFGLS